MCMGLNSRLQGKHFTDKTISSGPVCVLINMFLKQNNNEDRKSARKFYPSFMGLYLLAYKEIKKKLTCKRMY